MGEYIASKRKRIPYSMMNFAVIRRDDCYYVDKTRFIPIIEDADKFFFFKRPRRFGKSLTVKFISSSMSTTTLPMPSSLILRVCIVTPTRHMAKDICAPSSTRWKQESIPASSAVSSPASALLRWTTSPAASTLVPTIPSHRSSTKWWDSRRRKCERCWPIIPLPAPSITLLMNW